MKKSIYRKFKDYIEKNNNGSTSIFGTIGDNNLILRFFDENTQKFVNWSSYGSYNYEKDFLLEYYVVGIFPYWELVEDRIVAKIKVCLTKEKPNHEKEN